MDREAFATALRQARERRGLRQDELAEELGYRQSSLSAWESAKSLPTAEDVFRTEALLDLDPGTLSRHLGYLPVDAGSPSTEAVIREDDHLDPEYRDQLVSLYWIFRRGTATDGTGPRRARSR